MKRPVGITIIAILAIVSGVMLIFGGLSSLVSGAFFASISIENVMNEIQRQEQGRLQALDVAELHALVQLLGSSSIAMGAIVIVIGMVFSCSLWTIKGKSVGMDYCNSTNYDINHSPNSIHYNNKHA